MKFTRTILRFLVLAIIVMAGLALVASPSRASAVNPATINFQGKVVNANGTNVTDGNYSFVFRLYGVASGGSALWTETQAIVPVTSGVFQVNLGSVTTLTTIDFNANPALYLGITFNSDPNGEMSPRPQLQSVPFAFNSDKVGGLTAAQLVQVSPGSAQAGFINISGGNTIINSTGTGTTTLGNAAAAIALQGTTTIGIASSATGTLNFANVANSQLSVLQSTSLTGTGNATYLLPTAAGGTSNTLCVQQSAACGFAPAATNGYVALAPAAAQTESSTTAPSIFINKTGTTANILQLQKAANDVFIVDNSGNVGIGVTSAANPLVISRHQSGLTVATISNTNTGVGAAAGFTAYNDATTGFAFFGIGGTGYTGLAIGQDRAFISTGAGASGVVLNTGSATQPILFAVNGSEVARFDTSGNLAFAAANANTITGATNQSLTLQSAGTGQLNLATGSTGILGLGGSITTIQRTAAGTTVIDLKDAANTVLQLFNSAAGVSNLQLYGGGLCTGSAACTTGGATMRLDNAGNLTNIGTISAASGHLTINSFGDQQVTYTQLDGTSTAVGPGTTSTSLTLTSAAAFDVGNYAQISSNNCGGTGVSVCYVKITAKITNILTITPAITWANNSTVVEFHVPELGGNNLTQPLANRYGRGYFIAGVATGEGTTYYQEDGITTSLSNFNITPSASSVTIGSASTTVNIVGSFNTSGVRAGSGQLQGTGGINVTGGATFDTLSATSGTTISGGIINLNASSSFAVNIGTGATNTGGVAIGGVLNPFSISSTAFKVTTAGALSGITTISLSGAIAGPSSGNTINGLIINGGGLSGVTTLNASGLITGSAGLTVSGAASSFAGISNSSTYNGNAFSSSVLTFSGISANSITGATAQSLTVQSAGTGQLVLSSASGTLGLSAATNTIQRTATGSLTIDLANAANTSLILKNGLAGVANLNLFGGSLTTGSVPVTRIDNSGNFTGVTINATTGFQANGTSGETFSCGGNQYINTAVVSGGIITGHSACTGAGLSDQRLKTDIVSLGSNSLDAVRQVNAVNFNFDCSNGYFIQNNITCDSRYQTGVVAQQLQQIFPDLVYGDEYGFFHVDYQGLSIQTLKAVGLLADKVDAITATGGDTSQGIVTPSLTSNGALVIDSGASGDVTIDSGANSAYVKIGAQKAAGVDISRVDQTTTVAGALVIDQTAIFHGRAVFDGVDDGSGLISTPNFNVNGAGDVTTSGSFISKGGSLQLLDITGSNLFTIDGSGDAVLSGSLSLASASLTGGLTVGGDISIAGLSTFQKLATFIGKTVFRQDVQFDGHISVAADSAGYATLRTGETTVKVTFAQAYGVVPVVTATTADGQFLQTAVSAITVDGFDISVAVPVTQDTKLSWTAVGVNNPQTAQNPLPTATP